MFRVMLREGIGMDGVDGARGKRNFRMLARHLHNGERVYQPSTEARKLCNTKPTAHSSQPALIAHPKLSTEDGRRGRCTTPIPHNTLCLASLVPRLCALPNPDGLLTTATQSGTTLRSPADKQPSAASTLSAPRPSPTTLVFQTPPPPDSQFLAMATTSKNILEASAKHPKPGERKFQYGTAGVSLS